jgi:hypothetical protein
MSTKLDDLLAQASPDPGAPPDAERLWTAGRRRRRVRQAGAVLGTVALIAVVGVAATGLDGVRTPTVDQAATPSEADEGDEPTGEGPPFQLEREPNELGEIMRPRPGPAQPEPEADTADVVEATDEAEAAEEVEVEEPAPDPGPEPDAARVADPCAAHQGGEPRAFIDVVSPVQGQQASGSVELVGCSSVYEGTVRYRLSSPGGIVSDSFTTASAGGPEVGEFRETLSLGAPGQHTLEVFWESPADGSEADKSTIVFEAR